MNGLTQSLDFHANALVLRAERQRLLAGNIANADTPGFQARDMDFAATLRAATRKVDPQSAIATSHDRHLAQGLPAGEVPELVYARHSQDSIDRNTVDMDRERATFADNSVRYEATLRFINSGVRTMLDAMKSHNQG
jgi:flagellar basal-body rod protein FlgB